MRSRSSSNSISHGGDRRSLCLNARTPESVIMSLRVCWAPLHSAILGGRPTSGIGRHTCPDHQRPGTRTWPRSAQRWLPLSSVSSRLSLPRAQRISERCPLRRGSGRSIFRLRSCHPPLTQCQWLCPGRQVSCPKCINHVRLRKAQCSRRRVGLRERRTVVYCNMDMGQ